MLFGLVQLNAPTLTHLVGSRADPTPPHSPSCLSGSGSNPHLFWPQPKFFFQVWWVRLKGEIVTLMGHHSIPSGSGFPCPPSHFRGSGSTPSPLLIPSGSCASRTPWFTLVNTHLFSSESSFGSLNSHSFRVLLVHSRQIRLSSSSSPNSERILPTLHSCSTSIPAHTPTSFPAGSRARFKRPRAASNAATLSILFEHSCSLSPPFRPVPRGLSARVRRRTRLSSTLWAPPIFLHFVHSLFVSHGSAHLLGILHSFASLLAFSGHFVICFPCSVHFPGGFCSP